MALLTEILKAKIGKNGKSKTYVADKMGVTERTIENYINGNREPKPDALVKLAQILDFSLSELSEQNVPHETPTEETKRPYLKQRRALKNGTGGTKAIPFYDAPAAAGLTETEMTAIHAPAGTIDVGDLLSDSQAAIRIYGNSMLPNYPPGCVVGLYRCNKSFIEPGEVYVIETADRRILKRLFYKEDNPSADVITCYSWKHTGVCHYYYATNKDIYAVMRQLRHRELNTTMIYLKSLGLVQNDAFRNERVA